MVFKEHADNALRAFAHVAGNGWKDKLREAWFRGNYRRFTADKELAAMLQAVRNEPNFGLKYLENFTV